MLLDMSNDGLLKLLKFGHILLDILLVIISQMLVIKNYFGKKNTCKKNKSQLITQRLIFIKAFSQCPQN